MDSDAQEPSMFERVTRQAGRRYQHMLDRSTVHMKSRWAFFVGMLCLYFTRVYLAQGWYIVTYGLGIYLLNMFIGFLSPQVDPETEGPILPTASNEEYRPFARRVPEFKFWYQSTRAVTVALFMSFFRAFDIPVFWPILLAYFIVLFFVTMKRQIIHMVQHRYIPISWGKAKYKGKEPLITPAQSK